MAGLPGTGLGGIFYVLLVVWMAVRESWRLARGASNSARWARIGGLAGLSGAIILALWAESWAIRQVLSHFLLGGRHAPATGAAVGAPGGAFALEALAPALAVMPFATLAALLLAMHAVRLLPRRAQPRSRLLPESRPLALGRHRDPAAVRVMAEHDAPSRAPARASTASA
jgi:hypothetical protein